MRKITLDIDRPVGYVLRKRIDLKTRIVSVVGEGADVRIRRSCGGNTHVWILLPYDVDFLESLIIRARLRDDARRIRHDLSRYATRGERRGTGRLFDLKYKYGEVTRAGEWINLT